MSYPTYPGVPQYTEGAFLAHNTAGHEYQQGYHCAPPDVSAAPHHMPATVTAPVMNSQPSSHWEYDPFSHSEHQPLDPPIPTDDAPPLPPLEDAPPLPSEAAPPLPASPDEVQGPPVQQSVPVLEGHGPPASHLQPLASAQDTVYLPAPMQQLPQEAQPAWPAYQYPTPPDLQPLPQQDPWQQYHYPQSYQAYSQAPPVYQQPWQVQQQAPPPWQQQQMPDTASQPQAQHPWQVQTQPLPQPQSLPAPSVPPSEPQRLVTDSSSIFVKPGRHSRPKRVSIVLRGLPGSGKSHLAKKMKDVEVQQGGDAPRIHAIDDYFVTEVEKETTEELPGKKSRKRTIREMEYCYEAELEGAYKASLLRAYERTVREARFTMVIVDAPNILAEDLKPYWTAGQRGGYEVYIAEVHGSSPEACHCRNAHSRTLADIQQAAAMWQETPAVYPVLDIGALTDRQAQKSLQDNIAEVEMEDGSDAEKEEASPQPVSSRWASQEAAPSSRDSKRAHGQGQGTSKRAKTKTALLDANDYDGLTAGLDGYFGKNQGRKGMHDNASSNRGVLKKAGAGGRSRGQSVRWADEEPEGQSGFRIGGSQQLETIYVLEGLGPPKDQAQKVKSFKDQLRAEHNAERRAFRDVMLGGRRA